MLDVDPVQPLEERERPEHPDPNVWRPPSDWRQRRRGSDDGPEHDEP